MIFYAFLCVRMQQDVKAVYSMLRQNERNQIETRIESN